jgi:predicted DNA-binding transcriptional regulator AlpA
MRPDGDTLLTATELAHVMGLRDSQQVLDLRRTPVQFPEPVGRVNRSFVWSWSEVELWSKVHARLVVGAVGATLASFLEYGGRDLARC